MDPSLGVRDAKDQTEIAGQGAEGLKTWFEELDLESRGFYHGNPVRQPLRARRAVSTD